MLLSFLAIIGIGSVLAREVFLNEQGVHRQMGVDVIGHKSHLRHLFHDDGIVNGVVRILTP